MIRSFIVLSLLFCLCISLSGCASFSNDLAAGNSIFGSYEGDYVIISESGGAIVDVWVLRDVFCESEKSSDGWRFKDDDDNMTFIGGDVKVLRMNNAADMSKYHEYHIEFETQSYQEKFNTNDKLSSRYHLRGRTDGFFGRRVC